MQHRVERELADSDVALLVVNGEEGVGAGDRFIARALLAAGGEDADGLRGQQGRPARARTRWSRSLAAAAELEGVDEVFPISARTGEGLRRRWSSGSAS